MELEQQQQQLPDGWQAALHPTYQRYYYVHLASGTSQWEPPAAAAAAAAAPAAAPDPSTPAAGAVPTASHYRYYDPHGKLLGPFSMQQLTAWRAFLPMDLIVVPQQPPAAAASAKPSNNNKSSSAAGDPAAAGDSQQQPGTGGADGKPQHWLHLAELMGDGHLLAAWQQSAEQQQLLQTQQQQQQQQPWPPRARAPPAPVYESWCHSHYASGAYQPPAAAAIPAPEAVQAAASPPQQQQEQQQPEPEWHQHPWHHQPAAAAGISGSISGSSSGMARASSGFDKYAAAVLQGLPPDDEAVRLAGIAAAHGCTLQELLQAKAAADAAKAAAAVAAAEAAAAGTAAAVPANPEDRISYEQKPGFGGILLTKDPRSGRLTAVGGDGGGPSAIGCSRAMAVELYGDLARWVDPASLEQSLQKASKAKRLAAAQGPLPPPPMPPPVAASAGSGGGSGGGAAAKKMRLRL